MQLVKRIIPLVLVALLVFTGCGTGAGGRSANSANNASQAENSSGSEQDSGNSSDNSVQPADKERSGDIKLSRMQGTVKITDEKGSAVAAQEGISLYSGASIDTEEKSRAGISLDDFSTAVLDEKSRVKLNLDGKKSAMALERGTMYFSTSVPLGEDESFVISAPNMTMTSKDANGYAAVMNENKSAVIITSGSATLQSEDGASQSVEAGQCILIKTEDKKTTFTASEPAPEDYPQLLLEELNGDDAALKAIAQQKGSYTADSVRAVLSYRSLMEHPEEYDYALNGATATGKYFFAIARLQADDPVPTLLIKQDAQIKERNNTLRDRVEHIRLFRYNVSTGKTDMVEDMPGSSFKNVYLMKTSVAADGDGLLMELRLKDKPRNVMVYRINAAADPKEALKTELAAQGTDSVKDAPKSAALQWHLISDEHPEGSIEAVALPKDGDRAVLIGYLDTFSYKETIKLQGTPDWNNSDPNATYRMIVLDHTAYLSGHQDITHYEGRATDLFDISKTINGMFFGDSSIPADLDGHRIIFSVCEVGWASDSGMPTGAASADIHVLEVLD